MTKVKIGFSGLTVPEQIERARHIHGEMTGNANFTTPVPALTVVDAAVTALENAYNDSRSRDKNKVAAMYLRRKELLVIIGQEAAYVQEASGGDAEKIRSSGFDTAKPRTPRPVIAGEVSNLRLSDGSNHGRIRVDWDKADDAVMYVVRASLNADFTDDLDPKGITTKTTKEIGNFDPGVKVWVKVIALGREEFGPDCEPQNIIVR